jgi:hypothetical protein
VLPDSVGDQVVDDPPTLVRQQRVLRFAGREPAEVVREGALQKLGCMRALHLELAHVRDVEDAGIRPHCSVLRDHSLVLHGHLPAGKRHHPRSELDVPVVERRMQERLGHGHGRS